MNDKVMRGRAGMKLTGKQILEIRSRWPHLPKGPGGEKTKHGIAKAFADEYGVSYQNIWLIMKGKWWKHV
ncbi:MAG: hypothetical protein QM813_17140 [Verrucomicrobiota bacterium]